jgi:hypothetical protein
MAGGRATTLPFRSPEQRLCQQLVGVFDGARLAANNHCRGAERQDLEQRVVHVGKRSRSSPERHELAVVRIPLGVTAAAVETSDRFPLLVKKDDLEKVGILRTGNCRESFDFIQARQILRDDDVTTSAKMGRRHCQGDWTQDLVRVIVSVLPASDQPVEGVDIQIESSWMSFRIERGEGGFPDSRRAVQVNQESHGQTVARPRTGTLTSVPSRTRRPEWIACLLSYASARVGCSAFSWDTR